MARRKRSNWSISKIIAVGIAVLFWGTVISKCGYDVGKKKIIDKPENVETMVSEILSKTPIPTKDETKFAYASATVEYYRSITRTPPPPTLSYLEAYDATRWMRHTLVQETLERQWIEATMTWIVKRTTMPTERYLATVQKLNTQAVQQATMVVLLTEEANK